MWIFLIILNNRVQSKRIKLPDVLDIPLIWEEDTLRILVTRKEYD